MSESRVNEGEKFIDVVEWLKTKMASYSAAFSERYGLNFLNVIGTPVFKGLSV